MRDDPAAILREHRDQHYPEWCKERGLLNFAIWTIEHTRGRAAPPPALRRKIQPTKTYAVEETA